MRDRARPQAAPIDDGRLVDDVDAGELYGLAGYLERAAFEVQLVLGELWEAAALPTQPWDTCCRAASRGASR